MFACFLDSAIKAQNSSPEAVGDDNINHKNKRLEVLVGFLSLDSENPQKVLEAINAFSRDDQFYTSTGLEYLESVLPPGMPANFVKILSAGTSKTKFLKEFQNIFPLTEDQLKILAANNKKPGKCP
jgi:hypothetical protein